MSEKPNSTIALVTGVGRPDGIGFEACRQLAQKGMIVLLTARDEEKATAIAKQLSDEGLDVRPYVLDVTSDQSAKSLAIRLGQEFGRLDVLINNAAAYANWQETASTADLKAVENVMETNLFGAWRVTQALLLLLRKSQHARIVNVSSGSGSHGDPQFGLTTGPGSASYSVSKAALSALTSKLAVELKDSGILVNAVDPGLTATAPGMEAMGARPVAEGAASIIWPALLPDDGPTGGFFRDGKPLAW